MAKRSPKVAAKATRPAWVHPFLVVLTGTQPLVWRRIQVPQAATYWDLHVAIQDAMGWQDMHLHEFRIGVPEEGLGIRVGIDQEDEGEWPPALGWERELLADFSRSRECPAMTYLYDFGDDWLHGVIHDGTVMRLRGLSRG